jgi:hypothetical protein
MRVYNACGDAIPRPEGWVGNACFNCQAGGGTPAEQARKLLKENLALDAVVASVREMSEGQAKQLRERMIEAGEIDPTVTPEAKPKPEKPKKQPTIRQEDRPRVPDVEAQLCDDPTRSDPTIAEVVGVHRQTVMAARQKTGTPPYLEARRLRTAEVLRENPGLSDDQISRRFVGTGSLVYIRKVRAEIGIPPVPDQRTKAARSTADSS